MGPGERICRQPLDPCAARLAPVQMHAQSVNSTVWLTLATDAISHADADSVCITLRSDLHHTPQTSRNMHCCWSLMNSPFGSDLCRSRIPHLSRRSRWAYRLPLLRLLCWGCIQVRTGSPTQPHLPKRSQRNLKSTGRVCCLASVSNGCRWALSNLRN